jgi:hypothetical protein
MRAVKTAKTEGALTAALFAAHLAVEVVAATESATGKTPEDLWMFAPLAQVKRAAKAAMQPHGLMLLLMSSEVSTAPADRDLRVKLVFELVHAPSGERRELPMTWPVARVTDHKDVPQAVASSVSHAWRTLIMQLLCIEVSAAPRHGVEAGAWQPVTPAPATVWTHDERPSPSPLPRYSPDGLADLVTWWTEWETSVRSPLGDTRRPTWADAWAECSGGPARPPSGEYEKVALFNWLLEKQLREAA